MSETEEDTQPVVSDHTTCVISRSITAFPGPLVQIDKCRFFGFPPCRHVVCCLLRMSPEVLICRLPHHYTLHRLMSVANAFIMLIDQVRSVRDAKRGFMTIKPLAAVRCKLI